MADIRYRFRDDVFGGSQDVTLGLDEMPNFFPVDEDVRQNSHIGDSGRLWQYTWYRKITYDLQFESVGTAVAATFGSLVREGRKILWYQDIDAGTDGGTGTFTYTGAWRYEPFAPDLVNFSFKVREE